MSGTQTRTIRFLGLN